jgi:hypothetical protein
MQAFRSRKRGYRQALLGKRLFVSIRESGEKKRGRTRKNRREAKGTPAKIVYSLKISMSTATPYSYQ